MLCVLYSAINSLLLLLLLKVDLASLNVVKNVKHISVTPTHGRFLHTAYHACNTNAVTTVAIGIGML